jgi:hypothetical protein
MRRLPARSNSSPSGDLSRRLVTATLPSSTNAIGTAIATNTATSSSLIGGNCGWEQRSAERASFGSFGLVYHRLGTGHQHLYSD